ncbi:hypothetical protein [Gelidibacter algens]|nr:hypothetical protein [Gelidibacter algens]
MFAKEKGLYICTPQTRWLRPPRARKNVHVQTKKRKDKILRKKSFADQKRGCMFAAAKNGNVGSGEFIKIMFVVVDWSVKKNFQKKLSKTLRGTEKGFIFAPA